MKYQNQNTAQPLKDAMCTLRVIGTTRTFEAKYVGLYNYKAYWVEENDGCSHYIDNVEWILSRKKSIT